jgi:hypothetical protein
MILLPATSESDMYTLLLREPRICSRTEVSVFGLFRQCAVLHMDFVVESDLGP